LLLAWRRLADRPGLGRLAGPAAALRAVPLLGALWGGLLLVGAAAGGDDLWQPLQPFAGGWPRQGRTAHDLRHRHRGLQRELDAAKARGQWVLLDYYADWCVSCKVMENRCSAVPTCRPAWTACTCCAWT
jgi:thiol:disulfide interchange protein DsbD